MEMTLYLAAVISAGEYGLEKVTEAGENHTGVVLTH